MSKSRFGGLGGVMRGQAEMPRAQMRDPEGSPEGEPCDDGEEDPEDDDETDASAGDGKRKRKGNTVTDEEKKAAQAAEQKSAQAMADAVSKARAEERERVKAVAAAVASDDSCKGKAEAALAMLADEDFASLNASALVKMVAKTASPESNSDEGQQMLNQMREGGNPDTGNAPGSGEPVAEENHGWAKIHEEIRQARA